MPVLHNLVSHKELRERIAADPEPRTTISFYRYFKIEDPATFRDNWYRVLKLLGVLGRIYIAQEGINAQVSIPNRSMNDFRDFLDIHPELKQLRLNVAVEDDGKSFFLLKIKVRHRIVADGLPDDFFEQNRPGPYLDARSFNELCKNPETVVVDMRNHYEYEVGHFKEAVEIPSDTFREQLPMAADMLKTKKDKPIIMYCTGGIRCEKASAYMIQQGFSNVYHLEGGIIHYSQKAKELGLENRFIGKNFVFDERRAERISNEVIAQCHQCGQAADTHTNCANEACHLLFIQCESCAAHMQGCCTEACRDVLALPEETRKSLRKGVDRGAMIFNKSKAGRLRPRLPDLKTQTTQ